MAITGQPDEQVFIIPTATDEQVRAIQVVRESMARVLDGLEAGQGCDNGRLTFFSAAEQFQDLWNTKIAVFGGLLAPGLPNDLRYIATQGIAKDGKWGVQMRTCCAAIAPWDAAGIAYPPIPACQVALWLAAYPNAQALLRERVVNRFAQPAPSASPPPPPAPVPTTPEPATPPASPQQVEFPQDQVVLGTKARSGMPWWGWLFLGFGAVGGGYYVWRRGR